LDRKQFTAGIFIQDLKKYILFFILVLAKHDLIIQFAR